MAEPSYERHRDEIEARYQQRSNTAKLPGLDLSRLQSFLDGNIPDWSRDRCRPRSWKVGAPI
jgi:hypothetical protein